MRWALFFALILLASSTAAAQTIDEINLSIDDGGYVWITEKQTFEEEGEYGVLDLPSNIENLKAYDSRGPLKLNVTENEKNTEAKLFFRDYLDVGERSTVVIAYGTNLMTKKEGQTWYLKYSSKTTPRTTIMRVSFPDNSKILKLKPEDMLRSYVQKGVWVYPQQEFFAFEGEYQVEKDTPEAVTTTIKQENPPANEPNDTFDWEKGLIIALLVFSASIMAYIYHNRQSKGSITGGDNVVFTVDEGIIGDRELSGAEVKINIKDAKEAETETKVKESIIRMLNENELRIVRLLEDSEEDEITQAYIHKTLGIPKSSLSDILKHIEKRRIIERRGEGRVKWIRLRRWVFE